MIQERFRIQPFASTAEGNLHIAEGRKTLEDFLEEDNISTCP